MPRFQLLAPAKNVCGGGVILAIVVWVTWAITFGTFVTLTNRWNFCDSECYEILPNPICWESNITNTTTLCYGAASLCYDKCIVPYEEQVLSNFTNDGSSCRELNNCDAISAEEQFYVNECSVIACEGVPQISTSQSVMIILGLLLLLLSGTVCLNCYKEAATKPKCSPCKEAGGRICLYGSTIGTFILIIFTIIQLVAISTDSGAGGGWLDLIIMVFAIYTAVINAIFVVCACVGRGLLAKKDSSDNERVVNVEEGVAVAVPVVEQTNPVLVKAVVE